MEDDEDDDALFDNVDNQSFDEGITIYLFFKLKAKS